MTKSLEMKKKLLGRLRVGPTTVVVGIVLVNVVVFVDIVVTVLNVVVVVVDGVTVVNVVVVILVDVVVKYT